MSKRHWLAGGFWISAAIGFVLASAPVVAAAPRDGVSARNAPRSTLAPFASDAELQQFLKRLKRRQGRFKNGAEESSAPADAAAAPAAPACRRVP